MNSDLVDIYRPCSELAPRRVVTSMAHHEDIGMGRGEHTLGSEVTDSVPEPLVVTVLIRSTPAELSGQAAEAIALITAYADRINAVPVGRAVISFAHGRVKVEIAESLPSPRLAPPPQTFY
jgi:hypothetical protein